MARMADDAGFEELCRSHVGRATSTMPSSRDELCRLRRRRACVILNVGSEGEDHGPPPDETIRVLLSDAGFEAEHTWTDERGWFSVTLALIGKAPHGAATLRRHRDRRRSGGKALAVDLARPVAGPP